MLSDFYICPESYAIFGIRMARKEALEYCPYTTAKAVIDALSLRFQYQNYNLNF